MPPRPLRSFNADKAYDKAYDKVFQLTLAYNLAILSQLPHRLIATQSRGRLNLCLNMHQERDEGKD